MTLIEVVVVLAMLLVIVLAAVGAQRAVQAVWSEQSERMSVQGQVRLGLERLVRDLRQAREIVDLEAAEVTFTSPSGISVRYWVEAVDSTLRRSEDGGAGRVVARHIDALTLDQSGRLVTASLQGERGGRPFALTARVYLRQESD